MDGFSWLITLIGIFLVFLVLRDVYLTVLHGDNNGPIANWIKKFLWAMIMAVVKLFHTNRDTLFSFAGPIIIVITFTLWLAIYILGFSLIYWPHVEQFRAFDEITQIGFFEILYFSGVNGTIIGFGDITPVHGGMRIISFLQSGLSIAVFLGFVTYLTNVVPGVIYRNALTLRLWLETNHTGDGTIAVNSLANDDSKYIYLRIKALFDILQKVHQKMNRFPILDFIYRSKDPAYSPEMMLKTATELAIAAQVISNDQHYRRLLPVSKNLEIP